MLETKRILAIETSGRYGSVATLVANSQGARLLGQTSLQSGQRTAQSLAPAIKDLLSKTGWGTAPPELIAVAIGPGSFTGLRIGVTTAKALAYAFTAEIIGVNTLEALAIQTPASGSPLWTILDAQRQELFAAKFDRRTDKQLRTLRDASIISQEAWLADLEPGDRVTGTALSRLESRLPSGVELVSKDLWHPMAEAIGYAAWRAYQSGRRDDLWRLTPNYYRASAAEEKLST